MSKAQELRKLLETEPLIVVPGVDGRDMGYKMAIFPLVTLIGTIGGCLKMCKALLDEGRFDNAGLPFNFQEMHDFLGLDQFRDLEGKYTSK